MKAYAQTPEGWVWIDIPDPAPAEKTDMQKVLEGIEKVKVKLGIV